jgi:hypothetical protein
MSHVKFIRFRYGSVKSLYYRLENVRGLLSRFGVGFGFCFQILNQGLLALLLFEVMAELYWTRHLLSFLFYPQILIGLKQVVAISEILRSKIEYSKSTHLG